MGQLFLILARPQLPDESGIRNPPERKQTLPSRTPPSRLELLLPKCSQHTLRVWTARGSSRSPQRMCHCPASWERGPPYPAAPAPAVSEPWLGDIGGTRDGSASLPHQPFSALPPSSPWPADNPCSPPVRWASALSSLPHAPSRPAV